MGSGVGCAGSRTASDVLVTISDDYCKKKNNALGCQAAQEVRRYILKKHYMDIERKKVAEFKQANRKKTSEARRELARTMNLSNKSSISNMSKKQRACENRKAKAKAPRCINPFMCGVLREANARQE